MNSEVLDVEKIKRNCIEFAKSQNCINVLKCADGNTSYKEIASKTGINANTVSGLLAKARKLGIADKLENGNYKKKAGILSFMPKQKSGKLNSKSVGDVIEKISKIKKVTKGPFPNFNPSNKTLETMSKMTSAYTRLYAVENMVRDLIRNVLSAEQNWWISCVPEGIQKDVSITINKTPYHAVARKDELDYTHLGQLKEIIIYKKNWDKFLPHLNSKDKNDFSATIDKAIPSRNAIGHCIPLKNDDVKVVDVRFHDILKMIK